MLGGYALNRRSLTIHNQEVTSGGTVQFMDELRDEFRDAEFAIAQPDWSREALERWWDPGRQLVRSIRRYQKWKQRGGLLGRLGSKVAVLHYRFWSVVSASEIPLTCKLGGGLLLTHPNGVIIHPDAEVGANCLFAAGNAGGRREGGQRRGYWRGGEDYPTRDDWRSRSHWGQCCGDEGRAPWRNGGGHSCQRNQVI